ncbi:solute carrier family 22 member 7-like [Lissotriton helveticus]
MKLEELLLDAGGFGRFQILILLLLVIHRATLSMHFLLHNFISVVPPHRCTLQNKDVFGNLTEEEMLLISIPREPDGTFSSCKMYREPQWDLLENYTLGPPYSTTWGSSNASALQACQHGWDYDHSQFMSTIATEWDLVCERKWLTQASATFFFIGVTVGAVLIGYLSDRYGRRTMLLVCCVCSVVFAMTAAVALNYPMFVVFRSLSGVTLSGFPMLTTALGVEWVDTKHRTLAGFLTSTYWSIGIMLLPLVAYLIRDWRWLLIAVTCPYLLGIISIWWIPESVRWLLTKGKVKEAHALLVQCSSMNGQAHLSSNINTEVLSKVAEEENPGKHYSFIDLFRTPVLTKVSICAAAVWCGAFVSYYGISLNITGFELDMYMTQFLFGAVEIPFKLGVYIFMKKGGRRHALAWTLLIFGFCIGINIVIPEFFGALRTTIAVIGKGFAGAIFTTLILFSTELYPTVLRHNGFGFNSFIGRIGTSVAPLILLLDEAWKPLPQVIYCSVAILSSLVTYCLHETFNIRLPETVKDVEETWDQSMSPTVDPKEVIQMEKF